MTEADGGTPTATEQSIARRIAQALGYDGSDWRDFRAQAIAAIDAMADEYKVAVNLHDDLVAALRDARNYIECSAFNISGDAGKKNYRGCVARIDAVLAKVKP